MAHKGISDEELSMLLSPVPEHRQTGEPEKPKLSMKLLYELIKKLKQENAQLTERVAEYELKLDMLLQSREEVATALALPVLAEPETAQLAVVPCAPLPQTLLMPRSKRHRSPGKQSIGSLFVKAIVKLFGRRRKGYPSRYRSLF